MATSSTVIANGALQLLGAKRIETITDPNSANARSLNAAYDRTRRTLLRKYDWGFAMARASIAADPVKTTWGDHNRFSLPNDYIRLIRDNETGANLGGFGNNQAPDWRIEGMFIVTNDAAPLNIRYIADVTDPNTFDSAFHEAFENRLAFVCCKEITGSTDLRGRLKDEFLDVIAEAKRAGAIEKPAQEFPEDDWINSRL